MEENLPYKKFNAIIKFLKIDELLLCQNNSEYTLNRFLKYCDFLGLKHKCHLCDQQFRSKIR